MRTTRIPSMNRWQFEQTLEQQDFVFANGGYRAQYMENEHRPYQVFESEKGQVLPQPLVTFDHVDDLILWIAITSGTFVDRRQKE